MNNKTVNILLSLLIWAAGGIGVYFIKDQLPKQLNTAKAAVAKAAEGTAERKQEELKDIIKRTQRLVVTIQTPSGMIGSGFLYNEKGDVITNAHVVAGEQAVTVKTEGGKELSGYVIGISTKTDVAVVRVQDLQGMKPLAIANRKAEIGDEVIAMGSPHGLQNTVTLGNISGLDRSFDLEPYHYTNLYQISAPIAPGNSGGPLLDRKTGEVLGINSLITQGEGSIGYSIPIQDVLILAEGWSASSMKTLPVKPAAETDETGDFPIEEEAAALVSSYYDSLNEGDYVTAYSMLGSKWKQDVTYETFREGYLNTKSVSIENLQVENADKTVTVTCVIAAAERTDTGDTVSKYNATYTVGFENERIRILSGTAQKQ